MTTQMIEKNFSNFSAWHYRSKLLVKIHESNDGPYDVPLDLIQAELEKIKHAIFTEPNDQSSWNYHRWLVSLLIPLHVIKIEISDNHRLKIDFSDILWDNSQLELIINGQKIELKSTTSKPESRYFEAEISEDLPQVEGDHDYEVKLSRSSDSKLLFKEIDSLQILKNDKSKL